MLIAKIENGQVGRIVECRQVYGNRAPTDEELAQKSYMKVNTWREHDRLTQRLVPCTPVIEGNWVYTVAVSDMTEAEIQADKDSAMAQIRGQRNQLLSQTDYTQIPDNPDPKKADWAAYRQVLRDLPSSITGDPRTFKDWPDNPNAKPKNGE